MTATRASIAQRPRLSGIVSAAAAAPFTTALLVSVALAALSAAVLPTVPSYDPWSWIVWGREVFDPQLSFTVGGGPSWKPLPVIFTTFFGLFGAAAPTLWVIAARVGGLMALIAAYRLASRLVRRVTPEGAPGWALAAGLLAAAGILLTQEWFYYMFRGTSEPTLVGASLWAIDRHLDRHYAGAFLLGVAASLIRPEAWPFVFVYAVWLWRGQPRLRLLLVLGLLAIPFFWFVPPWIGTGQPFIAASHAKAYDGHLGSHPFLEVMRRGADLQVLPSLVLAVVAVAISWFGERDRVVLGLGVAAATWWVLVVGMTLDGYPGLERFFLPAAGISCVLAGLGVVRLAQFGSALVSRHVSTPGLAWVIAIVLVGVSIPFTITRLADARAAKPIADRAVTRLDQLSAAVTAVGGHAGVYPCKSSFAAVNHGVQTALAWKLHVTLERVGTSMRHPGVWFVGPHDSIDGAPARLGHGLTRIKFLGQIGAWRMYRVWRPGRLTPCVGR